MNLTTTERPSNALQRLVERLPLDSILPTIRGLLPARQYEMVEHVAYGCTLKETAWKLKLNINSVMYHWQRINQSLGTTNRQASILMLGFAAGFLCGAKVKTLPDDSGQIIDGDTNHVSRK